MRQILGISLSLFALTIAADAFADEDEATTGDEDAAEQEAPRKQKRKRRVVEEDDEADEVVVVERRGRRDRRPKRLPPTPGERPPEGYVESESNLRGVWIGGVSMLSAGYFVSILGGGIADAVEDHEDGKYLWYGLIPVAGPFVIAGHKEIESGGKAVFILLGAVEAAGLGMTIGGLATKKKVWLRDDVAEPWDPELRLGVGSAGVRMAF
ncbi:MAG: hypothetical protein HOV80_28560 [Polyangiaceae bacterium]|nr:hypothetical protein [Polyangiaceae bacterium]